MVDLALERIIAAGVIRTAKVKGERATAAVADGRRGLKIRRGIALVLSRYEPIVIAQEGNSGSKSADAAAKLARAQQACLDAIDEYLEEGMPLVPTQQAVKKSILGRWTGVTKDDLEQAAVKRWPTSDFAKLLGESITGPVPRSEWENAYDAACVAHCVWDEPQVAALRKIAG